MKNISLIEMIGKQLLESCDKRATPKDLTAEKTDESSKEINQLNDNELLTLSNYIIRGSNRKKTVVKHTK